RLEPIGETLECSKISEIERRDRCDRQRDAVHDKRIGGPDALEHRDGTPPRNHEILGNDFKPVHTRSLIKNIRVIDWPQAKAHTQRGRLRHRLLLAPSFGKGDRQIKQSACLETESADGAALGFAGSLGFGRQPAMALTGILALARVARGLAGALALARVDPHTLDSFPRLR